MIDTGLAMIEAIPGGQVVGLIAAMGYWFNAVVASTVIPAIKSNAVFLSDGLKMIQNTVSGNRSIWTKINGSATTIN